MNLGEILKDLREEKSLSQLELAKQLGIDNSTVGKYELNQREPKLWVLCKYADFFGVSLDYLAGREE